MRLGVREDRREDTFLVDGSNWPIGAWSISGSRTAQFGLFNIRVLFFACSRGTNLAQCTGCTCRRSSCTHKLENRLTAMPGMPAKIYTRTVVAGRDLGETPLSPRVSLRAGAFSS